MALTERQTKRKQWLETMLDAMQSRLSGDIATGGSTLSINGRNIQRYTLEELNTMYQQYTNELQQLDRIESGRPRYGAVRVRF